MDRYHVLHLVGQGCFGKVYKGRRRFSGQIVAMKFISKRGKNSKDIQNLKHEIRILQRLDHPNIIRLLDSYETTSDFVVITEFALGELFEVFQDDKHLPEEEIRSISTQLVRALDYLHSNKIIHRDMKPQNVLISAGDIIKLCDFGFARAMSVQTVVLTSIKGTPLYMAPELVQEKPYDCSADLWSLGVICYELFVGQPPFYTNSLIALMHLIVENPVAYPDNMSPDFKSFLQGLLQKNPKQRLGWPTLLHHPFIKDALADEPPETAPRPPQRAVEAPTAGSPKRRPSVESPSEPSPAGAAAVAGAPPAGSLAAMGKWLPAFAEAASTPAPVQGGELAKAGGDPGFARMCLAALEAYADALESGTLPPTVAGEGAKATAERRGLLISLVGEPGTRGALPHVSLSALVRGLVHFLSLAVPPSLTPALQALFASPLAALQLLRLLRALTGERAGQLLAWDLLSDIARLLGLWLRTPLAFGMGGLVRELLGVRGALVQYLSLAPLLVAGGVSGRLSPQGIRRAPAAGIHHLGTAINSMKCLGVVFTHLAQAAASHPPSSFAADLLNSVGGPGGLAQKPFEAQAAALALQVVCQCLLFKPSVGAPGERLLRAALQATSALLHPSSAGPERTGLPWGAEEGRLVRWTSNEASRLKLAIRGAREAVRSGLRSILGEMALYAPSEHEVDVALLSLLWDLHLVAGERLDSSALKVLLGFTGLSAEMSQRFAKLQTVAQGLGTDATMGPVFVSIVDATCAGLVDPSAVWPGAGLLLATLINGLRPFSRPAHHAISGTLAVPGSLDVGASELPQAPKWCSLALVQLLGAQLQSALQRNKAPTPLPIVCACYSLELLAAMAAALQQQVDAAGPSRRELLRALAPLEVVADTVMESVLTARSFKACLDDVRRVEGALYTYLTRGPLDGVLAVAAVSRSLEGSSVAADARSQGAGFSFTWRVVRRLLLTDDPQAVLACLGPSGLLCLLDTICLVSASLEQEHSCAALRLCLAILRALHAFSMLPPGDVLEGLPNAAVAFRAAAGLALHLFSGLAADQSSVVANELHACIAAAQSVQSVLRFFAGIPHLDPRAWEAMGKVWWHALSAGMQLLSALVLHHHNFAHEFVQHDGLQMLAARQLLSHELVAAGESGVQLLVDALLIVSQLSRLSKEYYPVLHRINIYGDLRGLLACGNANVRAKACNTIGNMVRHSDMFYSSLSHSRILTHLAALCSDGDSACRKFASFAIGNSAFHSDALYQELAPAIPRLVTLLEDEDEKTRANAAGAIGNLVRNSAELCGAMIHEGALQGLHSLVSTRRPLGTGDAAALDAFLADSSVKIALFSLGNLAVHTECRAELAATGRAEELCRDLMALCQRDVTIHKYAQRLLTKLAG